MQDKTSQIQQTISFIRKKFLRVWALKDPLMLLHAVYTVIYIKVQCHNGQVVVFILYGTMGLLLTCLLPALRFLTNKKHDNATTQTHFLFKGTFMKTY